ncbi:MAG: DUF4169 family protein [Alphaproteobacteria bacterium]|nr:DUF4169 family protein [Alphaproteobacteria bacterium]
MAEIVNLRRAKKARARDDADKSAAAARLQHGRTKAEKAATRATKDKAARDLDGHRREE